MQPMYYSCVILDCPSLLFLKGGSTCEFSCTNKEPLFDKFHKNYNFFLWIGSGKSIATKINFIFWLFKCIFGIFPKLLAHKNWHRIEIKCLEWTPLEKLTVKNMLNIFLSRVIRLLIMCYKINTSILVERRSPPHLSTRD